MTARTLWMLGCLASATVGWIPPAESSAVERRPNVLFLFADDMRADSVAALGNPVLKTPHLDQLVRRGFAFHNA